MAVRVQLTTGQNYNVASGVEVKDKSLNPESSIEQQLEVFDDAGKLVASFNRKMVTAWVIEW